MTQDDLRCLVGAECARLAKLGSAHAIAAELSSRGITGLVGSQCECPIARGLADTLMISTGLLQVNKHGVIIQQFKHFKAEQLISFQEGLAALRHFVEKFDHGHFPQLVQE